MTCHGDYSAPACCSTPNGASSQQYLCGAWQPEFNGTSIVYNLTSVPSPMSTKYICNNVNASGNAVADASDGKPASELLFPACCSPTGPRTALQSSTITSSSAAPPNAPPPNALPISSGSSVSSGGSTSVGAIVGTVVGVVVALAVGSATAGWFLVRRRRRRSKANAKHRRPGSAQELLQPHLTNPWATSSEGTTTSSMSRSAHVLHTSEMGNDSHMWSDRMFRSPAPADGSHGVMQLSGA